MKKVEKYIPKEYSQDKVLDILMKFRPPLIIALVAIMVSTIGYMLISKVDLLKAFYMTILTVTTIGYGEMWDMGVKDRLFNIAVMTLGVGTVMGYSIAVLINIVTSGEVKEIVRFRKMVSDISALKKHYIILGMTDYVKFLVKEFERKGIPFVIVSDGESFDAFVKELDVKYFLKLDPSCENSILLANPESAVGAIVACDDDYKNLAVTLTVKKVASKLNIKNFFIFSVVNSISFKDKLFDVGADYVEAVPEITSKRLAFLAENPPVFGCKSIFEEILFGERDFIGIEEFVVQPGSKVAGKTLKELNLKEKFRASVIAIRRTDGEIIYLPDEDEKLMEGDLIAVVVSKKLVEKIRKAFLTVGIFSRRDVLKKLLKERENGLG
ncbi:potassium channel family protein [Desulfurobacterium atlanticum]|uniref:Voltage-gated potassium channel n=1 Tax=Desulfurobacterium atlanticum TaxID=240169 RepID=A0A238YIZ0_9BACT|nr:TrkA C-terminal domain-containing protein [Desulfurobacterium atlanticum]SNR70604.1 voltage-gated potassium channel [Desulfurobacterium atlanticum]